VITLGPSTSNGRTGRAFFFIGGCLHLDELRLKVKVKNVGREY
jgi:hypothetical protein